MCVDIKCKLLIHSIESETYIIAAIYFSNCCRENKLLLINNLRTASIANANKRVYAIFILN